MQYGCFTYTPYANYFGGDSFTYKANDGMLDSSIATVTIIVNGENDAPVCSAVTLTTSKNTQGQADPDCTDAENDPLTYFVGAASHGSASVVGGKLTYLPGADYVGPDSFTYMASDGSVCQQYNQWTVAVNDPVVTRLPANGSTPLMLRPLFDWPDVPGAASYTLQYSRYSNMRYPVNKVVTASQYLPTSDLPRNRLLYWRVKVTGTSTWLPIWTVQMPNTPGMPNPEKPVLNALVKTLTPKLDWAASGLPTGTTFSHYQVQVATDSAYTNVVVDTAITNRMISEYTIPGGILQPNTVYYWRLRSFNTLGQYTRWTRLMYFREALAAPVLSAPANGAVVGTQKPTFDWTNVTGATGYTIQISRYSNMSSATVNANTTASSYVPGSNLPKNVTLYWRVRSRGGLGTSAWTAVRTFTITIP